jgi:hypothetical protein
MLNVDLEAVSASHARELNKSISSGMKDIATSIILGFVFIALALLFKK